MRKHFHGNWFIPLPGALEKATKAIEHLVIRASAPPIEPEIVYQDIGFRLPAPSRTLYNDVKETFVFEGEVIPGAAPAMSVLLQIASGNVYKDDKTTVRVCHTNRERALEHILGLNQKPPYIIFYSYRHSIEPICKVCSRKNLSYEIFDSSKTQQVLQRFNRGEIDVLIAHPLSMGYGLNLQYACSTIIFYSLPWSVEAYEQSIARIYRNGQQKDVAIYRIVCIDTYDERVAKVLATKGASQRDMLALLNEVHHATS
jgi:SNF2 family DNA or RNA helicase